MVGPNTYKEFGAKPNFSEIARRHGMGRHTVAKCWREGEAAVGGRAARRGCPGTEPSRRGAGRATCPSGAGAAASRTRVSRRPRQAAAVRLEGGHEARRLGGRGFRVQRVHRHARLLQEAPVHPG